MSNGDRCHVPHSGAVEPNVSTYHSTLAWGDRGKLLDSLLNYAIPAAREASHYGSYWTGIPAVLLGL